jgi:hypothetical protein
LSIMRVDLGELKQITNTKKRLGELADYKFVIMKVDGKETGFMFTDRELEAPRRRAEVQREDAPKKRNFWQRVFKKRK